MKILYTVYENENAELRRISFRLRSQFGFHQILNDVYICKLKLEDLNLVPLFSHLNQNRSVDAFSHELYEQIFMKFSSVELVNISHSNVTASRYEFSIFTETDVDSNLYSGLLCWHINNPSLYWEDACKKKIKILITRRETEFWTKVYIKNQYDVVRLFFFAYSASFFLKNMLLTWHLYVCDRA